MEYNRISIASLVFIAVILTTCSLSQSVAHRSGARDGQRIVVHRNSGSVIIQNQAITLPQDTTYCLNFLGDTLPHYHIKLDTNGYIQPDTIR